MPLETATYIPDLVTSNPAASDGMNNADDHMRLIKAAAKNTFPNFTSAPLNSTQAALDNAAAAAAGTAITRIPLGTVALPGLTPVGDPNTGIYSPAADQLAIAANGVQVLLASTSLSTPLAFSAASYTGGTGQLVPIGATLLWWDDVLPAEGGYAWANGQIIANANTVCPVLLARWGTRFGGNGTTTMGVPDLRDTVPVGKSTMGGVASRALHTLTNTVLGALIGAANVVLTTANLPPYTPAGSITVLSSLTDWIRGTLAGFSATSGASVFQAGATLSSLGASQITSTGTLTGTPQGGTSAAVNNVQPSTTCNYIIRLA
jgi:microcystin-dependent protein